MHTEKRKTAIAFFVSVFITVGPMICASVILRNLGWIIGRFVESGTNDGLDFARIFEQLKEARLSVHFLLPLLFGVLFFVLEHYFVKKLKSKGMRIILNSFIFTVLFVFSFVCSLAFTYVNGIRFCDLLGKLLPLIDKL